jgi:hypothetical protein
VPRGSGYCLLECLFWSVITSRGSGLRLYSYASAIAKIELSYSLACPGCFGSNTFKSYVDVMWLRCCCETLLNRYNRTD